MLGRAAQNGTAEGSAPARAAVISDVNYGRFVHPRHFMGSAHNGDFRAQRRSRFCRCGRC